MMRDTFKDKIFFTARLFAVAVFLALGLINCGPTQEAAPQNPPQVTVATVIQRSLPLYLEFVGTLKSIQEVEIRARVEGYLIKRAFEDGADVKKGDLLFVIDPQEYEAQLARAQAQLAKNQAIMAYARSMVRRYIPLTEQELSPEDTLENWQTTAREREAEVKASAAAVKLARLDLSYCTIKAPISGRIGRRLVDVGNLVGAGEETLLATITQMDPIYVYFNPSERQLPQIFRQYQQGPVKITLVLPEGQAYPHSGTLDFINNQVDLATGTITMRAVVPNPEKHLIPGQYVNVRLLLKEQPEALLVPEKAISTDQTGNYVFLLGPENVVEQRYVQTSLKHYDGFVLIEKGLKKGDQIVIEGIQRIRAGMKVTAQPTSAKETDTMPPSGS
ncbi:MAG: efflux RND transporter periplasmic adaptor subunit [Desulfobacteraceae bacterium]